MAEAVKKLTVSYGAFSCTLEGFDEPFPVMKMVVDYFQSLADRDPSFGAHPERPDADYLRNLAQRGTNHGVEVETQENGVILRQTFQTMPETVAEMAPAKAANLTLVPREDTTMPDFADAAVGTVEMFETPEFSGGAADMPASATFAGTIDQPTFFAARPADETDEYDREERALERLLSAARLRSGTDETLAPGNPMLRIKDSLQEQMETSRFDDGAPSEALPDQAFVAEFMEPEPEKTVGETEAEPAPAIEMIGFGILPVEQTEPAAPDQADEQAPADAIDEQVAPSESEIDAAAESDSGSAPVPAADPAPVAVAPVGELSADTAESQVAAVADDDLVAGFDRPADTELALEDAGSGPDLGDETLLMPAVTESATESTSAPSADPQTASEGVAMAAEIAEMPAAMAFEPAGAAMAAPDVAIVEADPETAEVMAVTADAVADETRAAIALDDREQAAALTVETSAVASDRLLSPADDAAVTPQVPAEFDWHPVAVAADDETPAEIVRAPMPLLVLGPALMIVSGAEAIFDTAEQSEEPVAEQRRQIVRSRPEAADFDYDVETRRANPDAAAALVERAVSRSEDMDEAMPADDLSLTLDNFARKVGAASLPELLEASAAYVTIVSGQPRFSRASILNMVDELSNERSYTQEARIKSFGKLLRNGSILRVEDGKFAISHSAKFNYEVKISA